MLKNIRPPYLKLGEKVALVAPASPVDEFRLKTAVKSISDIGLNPVVFPSCHLDNIREYEFLSGSDEMRASDINKAFCDDDIKGIFCIRGGYGCARIKDLLDFEAIRNHPKPFVGFSDITFLQNLFREKSNTITYHAPMPSSNYAERYDKYSLLLLKRILLEDYSLYEIDLYNQNFKKKIDSDYEPFHFPEQIVNGRISGEILGGNLSVLCTMFENNSFSCNQQYVLFIEEIDEPPYKIDRMLNFMKRNFFFKSCVGIVWGQFTNCCHNSFDTADLESIIRDYSTAFKVPAIAGFPAGHGNSFIPLPIGGYIDIENYICRFKM